MQLRNGKKMLSPTTEPRHYSVPIPQWSLRDRDDKDKDVETSSNQELLARKLNDTALNERILSPQSENHSVKTGIESSRIHIAEKDKNSLNSDSSKGDCTDVVTSNDITNNISIRTLRHEELQLLDAQVLTSQTQIQISCVKWQPRFGCIWGLGPVWKDEPSLSALSEIAAKKIPGVPNLDKHTVYQAFAGLFNKLYAFGSLPYLLRVALPLNNYYQTASSVATTKFLASTTQIPVPKILDYSASGHDSSLGLEWVLMEKITDAVPLSKAWGTLDFEAKQKLVKQIAGVAGTLFEIRAESIGSIYQINDKEFGVGKIVDNAYLWASFRKTQPFRGPFRSTKDWLCSQIDFTLADCAAVLEDPNTDKSEKAYQHRVQAVAQSLHHLLPYCVPSTGVESFALSHTDFSDVNILVDSTGNLRGVVDWEAAATLPLPLCCAIPHFIESPELATKPSLDDPNYQWTISHYENTVLRQIYLEYMEKNHPEWASVYRAHQYQSSINEFHRMTTWTMVRAALPQVEDWVKLNDK